MRTGATRAPARARRPALAAWLLLAAAPGVAPAVSVPDWLRAQQAAPLPPHEDKADAVLVYSETVLTVLGEGRMRRLDRRAFRILRKDGERWSRVMWNFDPQSRVTDIHGWCIPVAGKEYEVKERDAAESAVIGTDGSLLVSDSRTKLMKIPGADPGALIGYEVEQDLRPYMPTDEWDFEETVPVREARYALRLPAGWSYRATWINHEPVPAQPAGDAQALWVVSGLPAVRLEQRMPPWRAAHGRLVVTPVPPGHEPGFQTWDAIAAWERGLSADRRQPTPELQRKAAELTAGATDALAKVRALAHFVQQDIRYVGIELGIGGWQPHAAPEVLAHRYGDCKDKSTLLAALLASVGIESWQVLVNTQRGSMTAATPPNLQFDHMILAIRLPEGVADPSLQSVADVPGIGRLLFFDPTNEQAPPGRLSGDLQANFGLVVGPQQGVFMALPQMTPESGGLRRTARFTLAADGTLSGEVQETRLGDAADGVRAELREMDSDRQRTRAFETLLGGSLADFTLEGLALRDAADLSRPLQSSYSVSAQQYARASAGLLLVRPRVLGRWANGLLEVPEPRQHAVEMEAPERDTDSFEIELPAGYVVDELPPPVDLDIGYASYHSRSEAQGHVLRYTRSLEVRSLSVPVEKARALRDFYRAIGGDERQQAVLRRGAP